MSTSLAVATLPAGGQEAQPIRLVNKIEKPELRWAQRGLLIATVACGILSVIPPLRLAGALALRSVAFLTSGVNVAESWQREGVIGRIAQITKVALVAGGLVALAAGTPVLMVASLAADIAYQSFEFGRAICNKDPEQAFCRFGIIVIDALALSAIAVGSWKLMVAAASISAFFMLTIACIKFDPSKNLTADAVLEAACCFAWMGLGVASAIKTAPFKDFDTKITSREGRDGSVHTHIVQKPVMLWGALPVKDLPTVPVGGNVFVARNIS